ncbi:MAG TPA: hypothetical protein VKR79_06145 [Gaiellaceae bacterium]|nr:hypothetical protein [Gaiellaceae bacterium]
MTSHEDQTREPGRSGGLRLLDKVVPLVVVGVAIYVAGRAVAGLREAERRLAERNRGAGYPLAAPPVDYADMWPRERARPSYKVSTTKKLLMFAMLVALIAIVAGGGTFATFSAETTNRGSSISSGTLTLSDQVNSGTVCNSYNSASQDNYNPACALVLTLVNQAPGVTDTSGTYIGGYAKLTLANTGSLPASLFSFFAPWVGGTLATQVNSGTTVTSLTTSALEGPVANGDAVVLNFGAVTQQFCASANSAAGSTTITIGSGYTPGNTGSCPASGIHASQLAGTTFLVGTRVNDTSSDTTTTNTDCWDTPTTSSSVPGATFGTTSGFNFNTGSLCQTALLWIQEQSVVGSSTYNFCWFGNGSLLGAGLTEDTYGACKTPTQIALGTNVTAGTANQISSTPSTATTTIAGSFGSTTLNGSITSSQTSLTLTSAAGFPSSGNYTIQVDSEQMTVTGGQGTTNLTVTRGVNGTTAAAHNSGATVTQTSITDSQTSLTVASGANFTNGDTVIVDNEEMTLTAGGGTTSWTVTRAANGTSASSNHANGATITKVNYNLDTGGTLHGNIDNGDTIKLIQSGNTMTCTAAATYYIGATTKIAVTSCGDSSPTTGQVYTSGATVQDSSSFTALNGSNPTSTISNFDTAHPPSAPIYMAPLIANATRNIAFNVQLQPHGNAFGRDIRTFYMGIYFPSPTGVNQNALQGLMSTFGIAWHIDQ